MLPSLIYSETISAPPTPEFKTPPTTTIKKEEGKTSPKEPPQETPQEKPVKNETPEPPQSQDITSPLSPPPAVRLKVKPPANEKEAFKRIKDYKIFKRILPPGAAPKNMEKRFFGKYIDKVKPYIEQDTGETVEEIINEDNNLPEEYTSESESVKNQQPGKQKKDIKKSKNVPVKANYFKTNSSTPVISKKLREEILKKYTNFNENINTATVEKKEEIHFKKYKYISYNIAVMLTIAWCIILFMLIYRRRL